MVAIAFDPPFAMYSRPIGPSEDVISGALTAARNYFSLPLRLYNRIYYIR